MKRILLAALLLSCGFLTAALVARQTPKPPDADKDYSAELPRIPPKEPKEALVLFQPRPGFRVELAAAEPMLRSPVALDFDERGRLFVAEFPEYNQYASKKPHGHGVIRMLEDTDGDGGFDKSTVYVDKLDSPTAVACYNGGVFVGCVPNILYCKDTDGDGKADVREPVFTGFGRDVAGEGMLNSFRWGLDNRFHVSTSLAGGEVRPASQQEARTISVRGQGFLFDPRSRAFELTSGGGQHGMSMDDWGRTFVCENSAPIDLLMYDGRYLARNPFTEAPAASVNIAPDGKFTKIFRTSVNEPWRVLRTRLRASGAIPGSAEGGEPSGFFTGATGVTIYRGDAWPAEYRGQAFVGEVSGNLIYRAKLERNGVGLVARRAEAGVEFLTSRDNWFRPVQFANGPDGNLYMLDMYRELIEGAAFLAPQILKHMDPSSGVDRGRVYRIVPENHEQRKPPRLDRATGAELVALLEHPNGWHRDTASRLLYERQDKAIIPALRQLSVESKTPLGRLHALGSLDGLGALESSDVARALGDGEPRLREHAIRLAEKFANDRLIQRHLAGLVMDGDANVRYQLAFSLGALPVEAAKEPLLRLIRSDGADPWIGMALLSSLQGERAAAMFASLLADADWRRSKTGPSFLAALARQIGQEDRSPWPEKAVEEINRQLANDAPLARDILRSLLTKPSRGAFALAVKLTGSPAETALRQLRDDARKMAINAKQSAADRASAIRVLTLEPFADVRELFVELLQARQPPAAQTAALETLGRFDDPGVPALVIAAWPGMSPQVRASAAETLFSRPAGMAAFFDAMEQGKIGRGDIDPSRVSLLQSHPDAKVRERAARLFSDNKLTSRPEVFAAYQKALQMPGDVLRGRAVFRKECAGCHQLEGFGQAIGADLSAIRDRGTEAILLNILDPNREVKPQFFNYVMETTDGRLLTGMLTAETANSVTIRRVDGTSETVARVNIENLRGTGRSFMPEGIEKQINLQGMADLLAFLNASR